MQMQGAEGMDTWRFSSRGSEKAADTALRSRLRAQPRQEWPDASRGARSFVRLVESSDTMAGVAEG